MEKFINIILNNIGNQQISVKLMETPVSNVEFSWTVAIGG
jgi:hypothetical protein